jgi:hypothetical protein
MEDAQDDRIVRRRVQEINSHPHTLFEHLGEPAELQGAAQGVDVLEQFHALEGTRKIQFEELPLHLFVGGRPTRSATGRNFVLLAMSGPFGFSKF